LFSSKPGRILTTKAGAIGIRSVSRGRKYVSMMSRMLGLSCVCGCVKKQTKKMKSKSK